MIKAKNINKHFGDNQILKNIDLTVAKGEIVSIVGASGAGKTTLLHILGTLTEADKDTQTALEINNQSIVGLSTKDLSDFRNKHLGFVFQFHQLLPEFTALENVLLPTMIAGREQKESKEEAMKLLAHLGLEHRANHFPEQLSGGEQQRVSVARALINKPAVVFADEPSGNLDTQSAEKLHQLFFDLRNQLGQTFVIVTHNEILANMADRKLVMKDGRIIEEVRK
ncbi:ABC transporter ATP-binding protein [Capnocytophaga sp. ARDL2]|uniref:ABC transporter ATP-binding protein n=1 Tax=Capnocytophaga sp. ARDL2 TaxID=3238809 RepID=UPI003558BAC1